jgi:hypothetical protein
MENWKRFGNNYKQRGEWVELRFMAEATEQGLHVSKPWGDSRAYDVGVEHEEDFLRVQVKSTTYRRGTGYYCQFKPHNYKKGYSLKQVDLFAAHVIPANVWYLIPASLLLNSHITGLMLFPVMPPKRCPYIYEQYREAWHLLSKSRRALTASTSRR